MKDFYIVHTEIRAADMFQQCLPAIGAAQVNAQEGSGDVYVYKVQFVGVARQITDFVTAEELAR